MSPFPEDGLSRFRWKSPPESGNLTEKVLCVLRAQAAGKVLGLFLTQDDLACTFPGKTLFVAEVAQANILTGICKLTNGLMFRHNSGPLGQYPGAGSWAETRQGKQPLPFSGLQGA